MIRFKDISIAKPCTVNMESLPRINGERFCESCRKKVYDFREKDEAYFNHFTQIHGKVCGIFYEDQIKATATVSRGNILTSILKKVVALCLLMKSMVSPAQTGEHNSLLPPTMQTDPQPGNVPLNVVFKNPSARNTNFDVNVYIDYVLYLKDVKIESGILNLPDTIRPDQKITVAINYPNTYKEYYEESVKPKKYTFMFGDADKVILKVRYKKKLTLIRKRRRFYGGTYTLHK